jgi:hypothetical protein
MTQLPSGVLSPVIPEAWGYRCGSLSAAYVFVRLNADLTLCAVMRAMLATREKMQGFMHTTPRDGGSQRDLLCHSLAFLRPEHDLAARQPPSH